MEVAALLGSRGGESSEQVRARVLRARLLQRQRESALGLSTALNATLSSSDLERVVELDKPSRKLLDGLVQNLGLSARAFGKVLRVARTIADLEGAAKIDAQHLRDAVQGRILDQRREP